MTVPEDVGLEINVDMTYAVDTPTEMLLQVEAADGQGQSLHRSDLELIGVDQANRTTGEDELGTRSRFLVKTEFTCTYSASVTVSRTEEDLSSLDHTDLTALPPETLRYLMPSRYCHPASFVPVLDEMFQDADGGTLIAAASHWVSESIRYAPGASNSETTAADTLTSGQGICRDFAHVLISMARARGIPARFAACFAPNVFPQDFHAVPEVWLEGEWHIIDPTRMASAADIARIGVGADAAEVAFLTIFGRADMIRQRVSVDRD